MSTVYERRQQRINFLSITPTTKLSELPVVVSLCTLPPWRKTVLFFEEKPSVDRCLSTTSMPSSSTSLVLVVTPPPDSETEDPDCMGVWQDLLWIGNHCWRGQLGAISITVHWYCFMWQSTLWKSWIGGNAYAYMFSYATDRASSANACWNGIHEQNSIAFLFSWVAKKSIIGCPQRANRLFTTELFRTHSPLLISLQDKGPPNNSVCPLYVQLWAGYCSSKPSSTNPSLCDVKGETLYPLVCWCNA